MLRKQEVASYFIPRLESPAFYHGRDNGATQNHGWSTFMTWHKGMNNYINHKGFVDFLIHIKIQEKYGKGKKFLLSIWNKNQGNLARNTAWDAKKGEHIGYTLPLI